MSQIQVDFKVSIDKDTFDSLCKENLTTIPNCTLVEDINGFTLKEKETNLLEGSNSTTAEIHYEDCIVTINAKCFGFGPIKKRHAENVCSMIKGIIERSIIEQFSNNQIPKDMVRCPKCGSTQIQLQKRGWSLTTGLIGSGKNERVCMNCLYRF